GRGATEEAAGDRRPASEASVAVADGIGGEMPPADHQGRGPPPNGRAEAVRGDAGFTPASTTTSWVGATRAKYLRAQREGAFRAEEMAGRRGSSEDDLPLRFEP